MPPRPRCEGRWPGPRTCSSAFRRTWRATRCCAISATTSPRSRDLAWVGYLSTVGVYGDWQGQWVDETSPTRPISERSLRRVQAERAWLEFGKDTGKRVEVFRLAGIYGPGRSVIDSLRAGTARRIVKPGQVFNRIHVEDVARVLAAAIDKDTGHRIYNVGDDEPAPPQDVVAYAAELLGPARAAGSCLRRGRAHRHGGELLGRVQAGEQCPHQSRSGRRADISDVSGGPAGAP